MIELYIRGMQLPEDVYAFGKQPNWSPIGRYVEEVYDPYSPVANSAGYAFHESDWYNGDNVPLNHNGEGMHPAWEDMQCTILLRSNQGLTDDQLDDLQHQVDRWGSWDNTGRYDMPDGTTFWVVWR